MFVKLRILYCPCTICRLNTQTIAQFDKYWGCSSVVERPLRMREAPGSIPGISNVISFFFFPSDFLFFSLTFSTTLMANCFK